MFSQFPPPPCPFLEVCYIGAKTQEGGGVHNLRALMTVGGLRCRESVVMDARLALGCLISMDNKKIQKVIKNI